MAAAVTRSTPWYHVLSPWHACRQVLGPVLFYELVRTGRRGRFVLVRCAYGFLLLLALWMVSAKYGDILESVLGTRAGSIDTSALPQRRQFGRSASGTPTSSQITVMGSG